jgi:hypothetical protein
LDANGCYISNGMVYCMGSSNYYGQLGNNTFNTITRTQASTGKYPSVVETDTVQDGPVLLGPALPIIPYDAGTPPEAGIDDSGAPGT